MGSSRKVQVRIAAKEVGAEEKSSYESFGNKNVSASSFPNIIRLRAGNVIFNYRDAKNMLRKMEVTEDFSCPFCLLHCACFKGLRYHLICSHDFFNFEFWVTEEYQAVNVSVKVDMLRSESNADVVDPRLQTFIFCANSRKRRRPQKAVDYAKHVHPLILESDSPISLREGTCSRVHEEADGGNTTLSLPRNRDLQLGKHQAESSNPFVVDSTEHVGSSFNVNGDSTPSAMVPSAAKSRKLSLERSDPRNRALLTRRQFFHSHGAQPMALDQVLADRDSEDEVDDDIADFEDRRMLDDFVDVSNDEKHLMHLWNSFVKKQRVIADGHIPWACEAFSKLHAPELVQAPLFWCWKLFMIKLWNHGLIDAKTMDNCSIILEEYKQRGPDPPNDK